MAKELKDFRQGDTKVIKVDYGVGFDITGYIFWFTLRTDFDAVTPTAQVQTTAGSHALDDVANGIAYIELPSDVSLATPTGKYVWDIQRVIPGTPPNVLTLLPTIKYSSGSSEDRIEVLPHVTKVDS